MDRDAATERDRQPGPHIDADGTRHYGDPDPAPADSDQGDAVDADAGAARDTHITPGTKLNASSGLANIYARCLGYPDFGTGDAPLAFAYPDTAHAIRSARPDAHAGPGRVAAQPDA